MSTSNSKQHKKLNTVTFRDIMLLYNMSTQGAQLRLKLIRATLGKTDAHKLTVFDFCKVEGITVEDFDLMHKRALESM